jgi:hypothetical protein
MNQDERDDPAIYLGLQDFEVKLQEVEGSRRRGPIKVLSLAAKRNASLPGVRTRTRRGVVRGSRGNSCAGHLDR